MKKMLFFSFFLSISSGAFAQTHPCDVIEPTVFREPSAQLANLKLGWCFNPLDITTGAPIVGPVGFSLQIDGGPDIDLGPVPAIGSPNASGDFFYQTSIATLKAGVLTLKAYTAALGMSASSAPITLTILGPPKAPTGLRIDRGPQP